MGATLTIDEPILAPTLSKTNFSASKGQKVFNWQLSGNTSCCNFSESDFEENESSNLKQAKENCRSDLNSLRKDNLDNLIFAHLNINSITNKFLSLRNYPK